MAFGHKAMMVFTPTLKLTSIILFSILIASLQVAGEACENPTNAQIENDVQAAFQKLAKAAQSLDTEGYFRLFSKDNFTALNADGTVTHSFQAFKDDFLKATKYLQAYDNLQFDNVKITPINCHTAILVNEYEATVTLTSGQKVHAAGAGTQVWVNTGGTWKLSHIASSHKSAL